MCKGQASPSMGRGENSRGHMRHQRAHQYKIPESLWLGRAKHYVTIAHFNPFRAVRGIQAGCLPLSCGFPQPYLLPQKGLWNLQAPPGGRKFQPLKSPKALASIIKVSFTVSRCLLSQKGFWRNWAAFIGPGVCDPGIPSHHWDMASGCNLAFSQASA